LSSSGKRKYLKQLQQQLGKPKFNVKTKIIEHLLCPTCKKGKLETVCTFKDRGPPKRWLERLNAQKHVGKKINV